MSWDTSNTIASVAVVISLGSFALTYLQVRRARHNSMIRALQGDKEAVGFIAYKLSKGKIKWLARRRSEVLEALCLATIFEGSDQSLALIYDALSSLKRECNEEINATIHTIENRFDNYRELVDLDRGMRRLDLLKKALNTAATS